MSDSPHQHFSDVRLRTLGRLYSAFALTFLLFVAELIGGLASNSLALLSDAGHMLADLAALFFVLLSFRWATKLSSPQKTFGYARMEILGAFCNGALLFFVAFQILLEAYRRYEHPVLIDPKIMLPVAIGGFLVNVACLWILRKESSHIATRSVLLHIFADTLSSMGVIVAAWIILYTGHVWIDPLISALVSLLILLSAWRMLREAIDILMEASPKHISLDQLQKAILKVPGVQDVHDIHVWTITSGFHAASAHVLVKNMHTQESEQIIFQVTKKLREEFQITHATLQIETFMAPAKIEPLSTSPISSSEIPGRP